MPKKTYGSLEKKYRSKFAGGYNPFLGPRQIEDDESPDMSNCDFFGKSGIGNRLGYSKVGTTSTYTSAGYGLGTLHTATYHQMLKFISNGVNTVLSTSTDGASWSNVTTTTFVNKKIDGCQAGDYFYIGNGADSMKHWTGAAWAVTTNGTLGYHPTYYNNRLWVKDETYPDRLNFSGQSVAGADGGASADKLGDFSDASAGYIRFKPGSGAEIIGMKVFKNALYVFLRDSIYSVSPASAANTFTITQITNSVGCISNRSIVQVEEDLFFAADDGVYSLGDVANYTAVRTTNKSAKIKELFDAISATNKSEMCAEYFNFKYHLFYSKGGVVNDSCVVYDIRYQGWLPWTNISATDACVYEDSSTEKTLNFLHPTSAEVYKMYGAADDDGTAISSYFTTKSFDEDAPDIQKVYFDHTFVFGTINGTVNLSVIFNDTQVLGSATISQQNPVGGMGRQPIGMGFMGYIDGGTATVTSYAGVPLRKRVSKKKFAVQYKISSSGQWQLDDITTTFKPLSHYAFPSTYKI